jgi:predicted nucleic acid-binding protein
MIIVSNTTPIIALSSIQQHDLLQKLFTKVYIPQAVYNEIKAKKKYGFNEIDLDYFEVTNIQARQYLNFLLNDLDLGEAEAILLSLELKADLLLIDERLGNRIASSHSLNSFGTLGILSLAKRKGIIVSVKPYILELQNKGFWYSDHLIELFLKQENEA